LLYFFYDTLIYVIIGLFAFASCFAMFQIIHALFRHLNIHIYKFRPLRIKSFTIRITVIKIIIAVLCIAFTIYWLIIRKKRYAWVFQDILGTFFCINILRTLRLPNAMICTLLLVMLFFYDIFFVFISPLLSKSRTSVMVHVATGGGKKDAEQIPMVFKCPHLHETELSSVCNGGMQGYSLLGLGDVLIPGLLIAFLHGFDLEVRSRRIYFITTTICYALGLISTFGGMYLMKFPQPALLYLVPYTLIPTYIIAAIRKEVKALWLGRGSLSPYYQSPVATSKPAEIVPSENASRSTGSPPNEQTEGEAGELLPNQD